jgi:hypothetical protein
MNKIFCLLLFPIFCVQAQRHEFSINDLISFTSFPSSKFEGYVSRRGFKPNAFRKLSNFPANVYLKTSKDKNTEKIIGKYNNEESESVLFQTSSLNEFNKLKEELSDAGYISTVTDSVKNKTVNLYQKANITVQPLVSQDQNKVTYSMLIEKKELPKAKDIIYAEDLLQLNSHENIATVFGPANVKKDIFYFSEKEINKCSVLFANTSMQVIFIWNDEANNRDIAFLIIGGSLRAQSSLTYYKPIELNKWQSKQGIYSGMTLRELYEINEKHINFYGWESEESGLVTKDNTGNIDFKSIGIQLSCLDCNEDKYYSQNNIINSAGVLRDNRRIYVSTLIILPKRKKK